MFVFVPFYIKDDEEEGDEIVLHNEVPAKPEAVTSTHPMDFGKWASLSYSNVC